jgi:hypothetical protein
LQTASEAYPDGRPYTVGESQVSIANWLDLNSDDDGIYQQALHRQGLQTESNSWWPALDFWLNLVGSYTRRSLTKETDRLVAVSALAKEVSPTMKGKYLAGLWGNIYLPFQLLWTVESETRRPRRTETYCAPSWSWASVDARIVAVNPGSVAYFDGLFMVRLLAISLDYLTEDVFGQVTGGFLKFRGWLKCLQFFDIGRLDPWCWNLNIQWSKELGFIYPDEDIRNLSLANLYLLPIGKFRYELNSGALDNNPQVRGLLLAATDEKDQYRRVGIFRTRPKFTYLFNVPLYPLSTERYYCSNCTDTIFNSDEHYHCSICDDGDFDLCQVCVDRGIHCHDNEHLMVKRLVENGEPIETAERIGPKSSRLPSGLEAVTETLANLEILVASSGKLTE